VSASSPMSAGLCSKPAVAIYGNRLRDVQESPVAFLPRRGIVQDQAITVFLLKSKGSPVWRKTPERRELPGPVVEPDQIDGPSHGARVSCPKPSTNTPLLGRRAGGGRCCSPRVAPCSAS
jgi:hypothetical protein